MEKDMSRSPYDFYPTPEWCYENLPIDWSQFKTALEPCKGDGRIVSFLENKELEVDWCEIQEGKDFCPSKEERILEMNPPAWLVQKIKRQNRMKDEL